MVIATFPLAKIGLLLLKQLSKPLANVIKKEAKKHPTIRKYVVIPTGKAYNWVEKRTIGTITGREEYEKLTEEEFVELGSNAIGEIVLFGLLTIILMAEISRQGDKKAVKAKLKEEELIHLVNTVVEVIHEVDVLKKKVKDINFKLEKSHDAINAEEVSHAFMTDENMFQIFSNGNYYFKEHSNVKDFGDISA